MKEEEGYRWEEEVPVSLESRSPKKEFRRLGKELGRSRQLWRPEGNIGLSEVIGGLKDWRKVNGWGKRKRMTGQAQLLWESWIEVELVERSNWFHTVRDILDVSLRIPCYLRVPMIRERSCRYSWNRGWFHRQEHEVLSRWVGYINNDVNTLKL